MSAPIAPISKPRTSPQNNSQEDWLLRNKEAVVELLEERWAESECGEWVSQEELLDMLAKARQERLRRAG